MYELYLFCFCMAWSHYQDKRWVFRKFKVHIFIMWTFWLFVDFPRQLPAYPLIIIMLLLTSERVIFFYKTNAPFRIDSSTLLLVRESWAMTKTESTMTDNAVLDSRCLKSRKSDNYDPIPLEFHDITPTRRLAYRKFVGTQEPTIFYNPWFFSIMDLNKVVIF